MNVHSAKIVLRHRVVVIAIAAIAFAHGLSYVTESRAQDMPTAPHPAKVMKSQCAPCHSCEAPSSREPCLRVCIRDSADQINLRFSEKHGPDLVILNELEDRYLPVPFDHKGHAEMAEMTTGCAVCHHYTPEGLEHPACKSCHEVSPAQEQMRKPGLKGAYHRQCMNCHREWSHETDCVVCHAAKTGGGVNLVEQGSPTKDDIVGRMHPPIPEPGVEVYRPRYVDDVATKILFRHKDHIHRYGLKCVECHREDNCSRCHEEGGRHEQRPKSVEEHHQPCFACHQEDKCERCHLEEGRPDSEPFDHASTGWPLSRYHQYLSCRQCHAAVPFAAPSAQCDSCHASWEPENFNHAVTGQVLDENHVENDCEDCHADRLFDGAVSCDECHEEDEGIRFPQRRPGPIAKDHAEGPQ